jgi:hypothetical protein
MKLKRIISIILLAILCLSLFGCSINQNSKKAIAAKTILNNLVLKSYELNVIFYGEGLQHHEVEDGELYAPVISSEKYKTKKELESAAAEIFSEDYTKSIIDTAFIGNQGGISGTVNFARYIESYDCLTARVDYKPIKIAEYDFSTTEITKISNKFIQGKIMTTNFDKNEYVEITLINEENGWRIDSATY